MMSHWSWMRIAGTLGVWLAATLALYNVPCLLAQHRFVPQCEAFGQHTAILSRFLPGNIEEDGFAQHLKSYVPPPYFAEMANGKALSKEEVESIADAFRLYEQSIRAYHAKYDAWWIPVDDEDRASRFVGQFPQRPLQQFTGLTAWAIGGMWVEQGVRVESIEGTARRFVHFVADGTGWLCTRVTRANPDGTWETRGLYRELEFADRSQHPFPETAIGRDFLQQWTPQTLAQVVAESHDSLRGYRLQDASVVLTGPLTVVDLPGAYGIYLKLRPEFDYAPEALIMYEGVYSTPVYAALFADHREFVFESTPRVCLPTKIANTVYLVSTLTQDDKTEIARSAAEFGISNEPSTREMTLGNSSWTDFLAARLEENPPVPLHGPYGWHYVTINYISVNEPLPEQLCIIELPRGASIGLRDIAAVKTWDGEKFVDQLDD